MRYARVQTEQGPVYVSVEKRVGEDWLVGRLPDFPETPQRHDVSHREFAPMRMAEARLLPPVEPSKIVCVGRNYREHAAELGNEVPKEPLLFFKPPSSLLAQGGGIVYPAQTKRLDFEGELGLVISKRARHIGPDEDVRGYIRGYTVVNDVTARDLQKTDGQWTRAKGFDTFCPVGPVVTDEVDPVGEGVGLETYLNGVLKQSGNTRDFLFGIAEVLQYVTAFLTLEPGDLIATGTPAGVGPMQVGDKVEVVVAGVGTLANLVVQ